MFITPKDNTNYYQRAWHGSGMDFNEFNPEKALTGAGDMVHGRFTLLKTMARVYKKHAKSKGLPSYLHGVTFPQTKTFWMKKNITSIDRSSSAFLFWNENMIFS